MLLRPLIAAALVAAPGSVSEPIQFIQYPMVHRVDCLEGKGSAFRIGQNHWVSVAHVTALHACQIDGRDIVVTEQNGAEDFSRLDTPLEIARGLTVDCEGYKPGDWYWAIGHAHGAPFQTAIALYATYAKAADGRRVLIGPYNVIPGMSGGPVLNLAGEVVGTVNAYIDGTPISLSRELRDTSLCPHSS